MRTNVYIDGFNLYYGAVRGTPFKWLDVAAMCRLLLPSGAHQLRRLRYFTARVSATPTNPQAPINQQVYLRALALTPNLTIHYGHFLRQKRWLPLVTSGGAPSALAQVWKMEEKGSDVSLASHLVNDAHKRDFDCAVLVSNDSDLLEPLRLVQSELRLPIGVFNPHPRPAKQLLSTATFFKQIRAGVLGASQLPIRMTDSHGTFHKPPTW